MDKDTALKLALHALGNAEQLTPSVSLIAQCREAITAIKQALAAPAQPEQEPVYHLRQYGDVTKEQLDRYIETGDINPPAAHPPQRTEQEPVAVYGYCPECEAKGVMRERRPDGNDKCAKGHTYPSSKAAQRTWVGLTDDELADCLDRAIEAKLKEKNTC
jgi:hypothetical protein